MPKNGHAHQADAGALLLDCCIKIPLLKAVGYMQHWKKWIPLVSTESFVRTSPDKRIFVKKIHSTDDGYYAAQKALLAHPAVLRTIIVVYRQQITACYLLYFLQNRFQCTFTYFRIVPYLDNWSLISFELTVKRKPGGFYCSQTQLPAATGSN